MKVNRQWVPLSALSHASYENMHVLSMKFLVKFLLPAINIAVLVGEGGRGGGGEDGKGLRRCDCYKTIA